MREEEEEEEAAEQEGEKARKEAERKRVAEQRDAARVVHKQAMDRRAQSSARTLPQR